MTSHAGNTRKGEVENDSKVSQLDDGENGSGRNRKEKVEKEACA